MVSKGFHAYLPPSLPSLFAVLSQAKEIMIIIIGIIFVGPRATRPVTHNGGSCSVLRPPLPDGTDRQNHHRPVRSARFSHARST
jgi:hypothetical protein